MEKLWNFFSGDLYEPWVRCMIFLIRYQIESMEITLFFFLVCNANNFSSEGLMKALVYC